MDPRVFEAMRPWFLEHFGNAASATHVYGWEARDAVDHAREQVASLIGASPKEIVFTSGATESDNLGIKGIMDGRRWMVDGGLSEAKSNKQSFVDGYRPGHIITCVTEHKAVVDTCKYLESVGIEVSWLPVERNGQVSLAELEKAFRPNTALVAIMYANNETGVIQPVREIATIAHHHGALFFCDATQAVGKIPVDVTADGIDLMAFTAHKLYGPKGIGALYVRRKPRSVMLDAQIHGGGHERGFRSGTLNVPGIVGFGEACALAASDMQSDTERISGLRNKLEQSLLEIPGTSVNGHPEFRLLNVTNICFSGLEGQSMMMALSRFMAVSSGSACTSVTQEPSFVLKAMGLSDEEARGSVRFSLGRFTTEEEIDYAIDKAREVILQSRQEHHNA
jgi:cysteine desulfurase